jgi:hypothetical protein
MDRVGELAKPAAEIGFISWTVKTDPPQYKIDGNVTNVSRNNSDEEWERHRGLITRYYMLEEKPLAEVRSILKLNHGFDAT